MNLGLFFTREISLKYWVDTGMFFREKRIYEEHLRLGHFNQIFWFTYGHSDKQLERKLKEQGQLNPHITVIPMPRMIMMNKPGCFFYSMVLPFLYPKIFKKLDVLKTNQMDGNWTALIAKYRYHKPVLLRMGYIKSIHDNLGHKTKVKRLFFRCMEKKGFKNADMAIVSSKQARQYIVDEYGIAYDKIHVIYNYVDTRIFYPMGEDKKRYDNRFLFVGRLCLQKNLFNLVQAIAKTGYILDIYGEGELKKDLKNYAKRIGAKTNFFPLIPNHELSRVYNAYKYFILPSFYEGMPKVLLEAMACGLVCIGTNVLGINEVIQDGVNGYLAENTDPDGLREIMNRASGSNNRQIVVNGIHLIKKSFSLENIVNQEKTVVDHVMLCPKNA